MNCVVTGGAGFIGSHLVEHLLSLGYHVTVVDDFSTGRVEFLQAMPATERLRVIRGSVQTAGVLDRAFGGAQVVYHLAAMSRTVGSDQQWDRCYSVNVLGTREVLEAASRHGVPRVVYAGSCTAYGSSPLSQFHPSEFSEDAGDLMKSLGNSEADPVRPQTVYAVTKLQGEQLCRLYRDRGWMDTVVLRYFSVYGPRQPEDGAEALVLGIFLKRWREKRHLVIYGNGGQTRDFVHVRDVAELTRRAGEGGDLPAVINIGTGVGTSVRQLAYLIDPAATIAYERARVGDTVWSKALTDVCETSLYKLPAIALPDGVRELAQPAIQEAPAP